MQRGIGALGETVARFDTVEATTVRFGDGTEQSSNTAEVQLFETDVVDNEATALGVAASGMQSGTVRFYSWFTSDDQGYYKQLGVLVKDASGQLWSKLFPQSSPP
jgi:hypothetical protein